MYFDFNEAIPTNKTRNMVTTVTRISSVQRAAMSKVFPNPVRHSLQVQCAGRFDMVLYDAGGRTVRIVKNLRDASELNVQGLARGTYILSIQKVNSRSSTGWWWSDGVG